MIKVIYNKTCGRCVQSEPLTSGMVGQPIHFEYSHDFDGLSVTAVFTDGKNTVDVVNPGNECVIPHEVLTTVGTMVKVGIYATKGNELVIPTVYATIGIVLKGADPSGDVSADPTLPVWAQIQESIGNLNDLTTEAKNNLVAAINEAAQTGGGGGSTVELDTTLTQSGKAADAKAVGDALAGKQDTIRDLEAIRTGAAKGATALQSVPSTYRTASEQDTIDSGKVDKVTGKGLSSNDYTDTAKAKVDSLAPVATSGNYDDLSNKPTIPTALPSPNALTFTGAVTGSYDGSAPLSVEIPSGGGASTDGGVGTGTYEFSVLASGTIPANTITAIEIGNSMFDTGITLGMLRQYKIFNMLYRCDSSNQYYCFAVGNPGTNLNQCKRFFYSTSNAINATILWLDSARTAVLTLCGIGNNRVIPPAEVEVMGKFGQTGLASNQASMAAINAYGNLADISDEAKIYVGVMHMNGQATNTKDFTWAICGVIK